MKETIKEFLSSLEGYHQRLKEIHWSTKCKAEHLLTDDIDGKVLGYEDKVSEVSMGILNVRFGIGDLKTLVPNSKELSGVLKEMESDVNNLKDKLNGGHKYDGLMNVLDDFSEDIKVWDYLRTFS